MPSAEAWRPEYHPQQPCNKKTGHRDTCLYLREYIGWVGQLPVTRWPPSLNWSLCFEVPWGLSYKNWLAPKDFTLSWSLSLTFIHECTSKIGRNVFIIVYQFLKANTEDFLIFFLISYCARRTCFQNWSSPQVSNSNSAFPWNQVAVIDKEIVTYVQYCKWIKVF